MYSDGLLAVVAGSDTTATAISALVYFLLRDPVAFKRLRAEIDHYFPRDEEPVNFTRMAGMPYLNACMWVFDLILYILITKFISADSQQRGFTSYTPCSKWGPKMYPSRIRGQVSRAVVSNKRFVITRSF